MKSSNLIISILAIFAIFAINGCTESSTQNEKAKYVFLFIGDGMGNSHVAATESYLSYKEGKLGGSQLVYTQFPSLCLCTTYSASDNITCSSAAGTAIACGTKTNNGMLGVDPEGNPLKSIAYELKEDGYKVGIMSSVPINHATPASFYGHNRSRSDYYNISKEIPASGFDFFGGPGFIDFNGKNNSEEDIDTYLERNGYKVCYGVKEFNASADTCSRVIFCQESNRKESAANYSTDEENAEDIALADIVKMAIGYLGENDPFFIMCEGGAIDWEAHSNKTMNMVKEVLGFNDAVAVAYEFYLAHPEETLIVVTADHETGGIAIGSRKGGSKVNWEKLEKQWEESGRKNTLSNEENMELNENCAIGWTTYGHSGAPVPTYAIGKGAEKFFGRIDNTDIKGKILGE